MKLGMPVGLSPGHIVLNPALPLPKMGTVPNFRPIYVVAKWLDGLRCDLVWTEVCLDPGDFVLDWYPAAPPQKGEGELGRGLPPYKVTPCSIRLATIDIGRNLGVPPPPQKGGGAPNFRPMYIVAKRLDGSRCHFVRR